MLEIPGYKISAKIHESVNSRVYRGIVAGSFAFNFQDFEERLPHPRGNHTL